MEWYLTILIAYFSFSKASAVILEGPSSGVYAEGTNVTLQCLAQGNNRIVWEDINDNTVIFIDKAKNTQKAKFDNFFISKVEENFSLTIVGAQLSDDGFYSCEEGDDSRNANVTVEAGPTLYISLNDTLLENKHLVMLNEDEVLVVVCKAEGSKPAVDLRFKFGEDEWIQEVNVTKLKEGHRSTTKARIVHRVTNTDTKITCQAFGQSSIPPVTEVIHIDIQYKPKCQINLENNLAKCQCVSNPTVSTYNIYVNGELKGTDSTLSVQEYLPANISCQAANDVGTGTLASKFVTPAQLDDKDSTNIVVVIIIVVAVISVIAVCGCLIFLLFRKRHTKSPNNTLTGVELNRETPAQNEQEQKPLVLKDGKDSPEFQKFVNQIAGTIFRDWEILAVEDLKLHRDEVKKVTEAVSKCHEQVKLAIKHWSEMEDQEISKSELVRILSQSPVCNDVQCNKCTDVLQSMPAKADTLTQNKTKKTQDEPTKTYPTESEKFTALLENVATVIGHTGALKLSKEYGVDKQEGNSTGKDINIIGEDITRLLVERGSLEHSETSLKGFQEKLEGFCLFRASNIVDAYILQEGTELQLAEYISEISRTIFFDWEILAIETLLVDKRIVEGIIKTYKNGKDQVKAVLHIWQNSIETTASRGDLEKIIKGSEIFEDHERLSKFDKSTREEPNNEGVDLSNKFPGNENGNETKTDISSKFQEVLADVSKVVGETGVGRILAAYPKELDEEPVEATLTTKSIFQILQNKEILKDDWESLKFFSTSLKNCYLFRASYLIDAYAAKRATKSSSVETQRSQDNKDGHDSYQEQDDSVQLSSDNLKEPNPEPSESEIQ